LLDEIKSELGSLMEPSGYQLHWRGAEPTAQSFEGGLIVLEIRGSCDRKSASLRRPGVVQLGSSAVADGKVLPFSWADCGAVSLFLEPWLTHMQKQQRRVVMGKAMARVIAHEFYHVLGRTLIHTRSGLSKSRLEPNDLLREDDEVQVRLVPFLQAAAFQ